MEQSKELLFGISSVPPVHLLVFLSIQQTINSVGGPLSAVYMVHGTLCAEGDHVFFSQLLSTNIFFSAICTLLQVLLGVRLPLVQGSSYSFIPPMVAMMSTDRWRCPTTVNVTNASYQGGYNTTAHAPSAPIGQSRDMSALWRPRVLEVNGALIVVSCVEVVMGVTGVMGFLMRFIGPLTIVPTIALIPLSIYKGPVAGMAHHWGITVVCLTTMITCTVVLGRWQVPIPWYTKQKKCHTTKYPIFRVLPYLMSMCVGWLLALILTKAGTLPTDPNVLGYKARTDAKLDVLQKTEWFFFPYPGLFGLPRVSAGVVLGMMAAMISSVVESLGDYYACAKVCQVPRPPKHALNRGVFMEGLGNVVGGFLGASTGTNTYSAPIGMIGVTGVASRLVLTLASVFMLICGIVGKVGAALTIVPDPVMAAGTALGLGVMLSVALSNLKHVDMAAPRNTVVLGMSLMMGLMVPEWLNQHKGAINTGSPELDNMLTVLLSTGMFVGGFLGFVLDNIIPGTAEERGMLVFLKSVGMADADDSNDVKRSSDIKKDPYEIPYIQSCLERYNIFSYVPCLPTYRERHCCTCCCKRCRRGRQVAAAEDVGHDSVGNPDGYCNEFKMKPV